MMGASYLTPIQSLPPAPVESLTDFESMVKETYGRQLATACTATRVTGP